MESSTEHQWICATDIAEAIGQTRHIVDSLRKVTVPNLRSIKDPVQGQRNTKVLFATTDVVAWLIHHIRLTNAQADKLREYSKTVLPKIIDTYNPQYTGHQ